MSLVVHEDDGPYIKNRSVNLVSFSSLFGDVSEKAGGQIPVASYIKEKTNSSLTAAKRSELWDPILADFDRLATEGVGVGVSL